MGISKQIGWSPEANLYYKISQQLERLIGVTSKVVLGPSTVTIGTQEWTTRNLDVATYRNGDPIPEIQDQTEWLTTTEGAWCYYDNDPANGAIYGKLYNWYALNDPRGLAPVGYHVPSQAEWTNLQEYLGGFIVGGGKLKEAGFAHWLNPNTGASNSSGFTGLPGGERQVGSSLDFIYINEVATFWGSDYLTFKIYTRLFYDLGEMQILTSALDENNGFSVRLLKD